MTKESLARIIVFSSTLVAAILLLLRPQNFPFDDGFFYLQVARNIVLHGQSTFHGITPTNGYHPLWMGFCIVIAYVVTLFSTSSYVLLGAVLVVQLLLFFAACHFLIKLERELGLFHSSLSICILSCLFIGEGTLLLLESILAFMILIYAVYRYVVIARQQDYAPATLARFSLILALMVLARLDLIFCAALMMLGLCVRYARHSDFRHLILRSLSVGLPCAAIIGAYLLANHAMFGSYMPVSGILKSSFPVINHPPHPMRPSLFGAYFQCFFMPLLVLVLFVRASEGYGKGTSSHQRAGEFLVEMGIFALVHAAYTLMFGHASVWYFLQFYLCIGIFGNYVFSQRPESRRHQLVTYIALFMACVNICIAFNNYWKDGGVQYTMQMIKKNRVEVAQELENNLPPDARVLVFDVPGAFGYYSKLRVFPSDGLMNDPAYDETLQKEDALPYMCSRNINYLVGPLVTSNLHFIGLSIEFAKRGNDYIVTLFTPKTEKALTPIKIPEELLIARIPNKLGFVSEFSEIGLWKLPCDAQ